VSATATLPSVSTCASGSPPSVTTDVNGNFVIVGDPSTADGGLCNNATYTVSATVAGYAAASATVTISSTGANPSPSLSLVAVANKIVQKVVVTDLDNNPIKPPPGSTTGGLIITDFSPIGSPVVVSPEPDQITYDLTIDPTSYKFFFSATGYTSQTLGPIPYSPNESPPLLTVKLLLDKNTITGTVTTPGPGGTTVPLKGVTVSLFPDSVGATAFTSVTTDSSGIYTLTSEGGGNNPNYIPDGTYILGATLAGYTYRFQPQAFQTTLPNTIVNLSLVPNQVRVSVAISSTLGSSSDLTGATVTLTPTPVTPPPPGGSESCGSSRLVPGFGTTQSATVASSTATFNQVVPDVYTLTASDPNHPAQASTQVTVCPDGSTSPSFTFQEGEVSGTVAVPADSGLLASGVTVDLFTGTSASGTPQVLSVSPAGAFSAFVPLQSAYTVQASMTGLTTQTGMTTTLKANNPSATVSLTLPATPREVDVKVTSGGTPSIPLATGTVTLSLPHGSKPFSPTTPAPPYSGTITSGVAKLTGVAPSASDYTITVTPVPVTEGPITASGSVTVAIDTTGVGTVNAPITAAFGQINATVTLSPAPTTSTAVNAVVCASAAGCTAPVASQSTNVTSGSATFTFQLPPSSGTGDVVTFSATGYTGQSTTLVVTDGATTPASITLTATPPTTTTTT
jgi:hypothetical protein